MTVTVRPTLVFGSNRKFAQLPAGDQTIDGSVTRVVPTSGSTVTLASLYTILDPAAALAALTVTLPPSPVDQQRHFISTTQTITALTINGGTIKTAPTTILVTSPLGFMWNAAGAAWYRIQ